MGYLIDSSVLVAAERAGLGLSEHLQAADAAISAITASELLHGVHHADTTERRARRELLVEAVLARYPIVPFDLAVARVHARLWADLKSNGVSVGPHDLIIGATAITLDLSVATMDARSFPRIPGVKVELW